ncbi:hypothetical protein GCM10027570_55680 [Streptomonospora sediminis]
MTTSLGRSRTPGRLLAALLAIGLALAAAAPAHAQARHAAPERDHRGQPGGAGNGPGGKPAAATGDIVDTTERRGKAVALTFDDGPDPRNTPELLDVLSRHGVQAVFCLWGEHVQQHPDLVRRIADEGHLLCNHAMHHDDMGDWQPADIRADLQETSEAIRGALPGARIPYFRAPYGSWGQSPEVAAELGMQPLGWSLEVEDWVPPGTDELERRLYEGITPRSVVLLHDGVGDRSQTIGAVDRIIPRMQDEGWHFGRPARR